MIHARDRIATARDQHGTYLWREKGRETAHTTCLPYRTRWSAWRKIPADGIWLSGRRYITGCGSLLVGIHSSRECSGSACTIHRPSDHALRTGRTHWRHGGYFLDIKPPHMERICEHGVGHPDPDEIQLGVGVHGCDGCCSVTWLKCGRDKHGYHNAVCRYCDGTAE
jgi:hypothetical protein